LYSFDLGKVDVSLSLVYFKTYRTFARFLISTNWNAIVQPEPYLGNGWFTMLILVLIFVFNSKLSKNTSKICQMFLLYGTNQRNLPIMLYIILNWKQIVLLELAWWTICSPDLFSGESMSVDRNQESGRKSYSAWKKRERDVDLA
jgi:hypothetical protein